MPFLDLGKTLLKIAGVTFSKREVNAIYFGNWLRDYSQAMDIMGLSVFGDDGKAQAQGAILLVIQVLAFMSFGFATGEFKVTLNKLGVYSHAEHIDNPIGYASDAKKYHSRLRGEVFPDECAVDPATGMKNYIAHEGQGYNTSANYVRQALKICIEKGRSSQRQDGDDYHEALRLLGSALHTLEDFLAHTNWCELVIRKLSIDMPEANVFCLAGAQTYIPTQSGELVPPLVTGTFGGEDFYVSLFGTVDEQVFALRHLFYWLLMAIFCSHLCSSNSGDLKKIRESADQSSMAGLNKLLQRLSKNNPKLKGHMDKIEEAKKLGEEHKRLLKARLEKPETPQVVAGNSLSTTDTKMDERRVKARSDFKETSIMDYIPDESSNPASEVVWELMEIRDDIVHAILEVLEKVGLSDWVEKVNEIINKAVWRIIAGIVSPAVDALSGAVAKGHEDLLYMDKQTAVFREATCADPTHSWAAKDHFKNALHLPAAQVAHVVVENCVKKITKAWTDGTDADSVITEILETFHHPYFPKKGSTVQEEMYQKMKTYWDGLGDGGRKSLLSVLTLEAVHEGRNVRDIPKNPGIAGDDVGDAIGSVLNFGVHAADKALEELLNAMDLALGVVDGIVGGANMVVDKAKDVAHDIGEGLEKFGKEAENVAKDIGNGIEGGINDVGKAAVSAYKGTEQVVTDIGRGVEAAATDVGNGVVGIAKDIGNGVEAAATDVGNGVVGIATDIGNGVEAAATDVGNGVVGVAKDIGNGVEGLATDVGKGAEAFVGKVISWRPW
ncbi:hypothetical protein GALMADRAFT_145352 [Galerina marginata CBS 339.88]|uniref:Heterokaryon incompatibility Het-C n=1 Tax=Galerina marginata (strain CBS 339.88) TaxID=685588 RepID=A0A067SPK0_GALM3|nr:hypothetical protein GALMADRAFT_145352 [Galerina marginata CBS 339.88]